MTDTFRETTHKSWFSRIGGAFTGALIGIVLVIACPIGLFWNEGRAVTTARSLAEGAAAVVPVSADAVDAAHEGKLVHVSGMLASATQPEDAEFGIAAPGVRLERHVEMYQWKENKESETTKNLGGSEDTVTTYTYSKGWNGDAMDSGEFRKPEGHANPPMDIRSQDFQVQEAGLGAFKLHEAALNALDDTKALPLRSDQADAVWNAYSGTKDVQIADNRIYLGTDPASPQVGDYRISYSVVPLEVVSIVAKQSGSSLEEYQTEAGDKLLLTDGGSVPAEKMFADAVTANTIVTWILRAVGLLVLGIAFALILAPVGVLADVVPLFGSIVRFGTGLIAMALTLVLGGGVIALAWFWYRPLLSLIIIAVSLGLAFLLLLWRRSRRPAAAVGAAPQAAWGREAA